MNILLIFFLYGWHWEYNLDKTGRTLYRRKQIFSSVATKRVRCKENYLKTEAPLEDEQGQEPGTPGRWPGWEK